MEANLLEPLVNVERQVDQLMAAAAYRSHRRRISDAENRPENRPPRP